MSKQTNNIWVGQKDLTRDEAFLQEVQQEFASQNLTSQLGSEEVAGNINGNRRDFLKFLGFGLGAATVAAGCDIPVKRAIPYVVKPDQIVPGVATYYASSFVNGPEFQSILVKTREGRPIKIEGNGASPVSRGATSARTQAYVLDLYNVNRLKGPMVKDGELFSAISWDKLDASAKSALNGGSVAIVTSTILSPTLKATIDELSAKYGKVDVVTVDSVSQSAMLDANEQDFGVRAIPSYHFDNAEVIARFYTDFLCTWGVTAYSKAFIDGRRITDVNNPKMSRLFQVESHMSLTGSNADHRVLVKPSELDASVAFLANELLGGISTKPINDKAKAALSKVAKQLRSAGSKSLIVCGSNNPAAQSLVNAMNNALGNIGTTVDFGVTSTGSQGDEKALAALVAKMKSKQVNTVIIHECNPVYSSAMGAAFAEALSQVANTFAVTYELNETSKLCKHIAPVHHGLESWGDAMPTSNYMALVQPTIAPLFDTRQAGETFLTWAESADLNTMSEQPYFEYLKAQWQKSGIQQGSSYATFQSFWDQALHSGGVELNTNQSTPSYRGSASAAAAGIKAPSSSELEIKFFETVQLGNGQYASNPWLQEMPDPIARTVWGNYLAVPVKFDGVRKFEALNGLKDGDIVNLTDAGKEMRLPVIQQFGLAPGTVALALGYVRSDA